jgi:hypothetical protein
VDPAIEVPGVERFKVLVGQWDKGFLVDVLHWYSAGLPTHFSGNVADVPHHKQDAIAVCTGKHPVAGEGADK